MGGGIRIIDWRSNGNVILFAALAAILIAAAAAGATDVFAEKKGRAEVTVSKWLRDTKELRLIVYLDSSDEHTVLGKKIIDLKKNHIKVSDSPKTFSMFFKVDKLHKGDKLQVCAGDIARIVEGCVWNIKYKPGKTLRVDVELTVDVDDD